MMVWYGVLYNFDPGDLKGVPEKQYTAKLVLSIATAAIIRQLLQKAKKDIFSKP